MADYISREAAIAFAEHAYNEWNLAMGAADGQRQINRCFKMQELCKAVASVFADSPTADVEPVRHGRWIPCSERLPDEKQRVLFLATSNETIYAGHYRYIGKNGTTWFWAGKSIYGAKYWMPLPEPPEEGENGNAAD